MRRCWRVEKIEGRGGHQWFVDVDAVVELRKEEVREMMRSTSSRGMAEQVNGNPLRTTRVSGEKDRVGASRNVGSDGSETTIFIDITRVGGWVKAVPLCTSPAS
jgi:hypothetical protein